MHIPGYNYLGPGTHINKKLSKMIKQDKSVYPINPLDTIAMAHDMQYQNTNHDTADQQFIENGTLIPPSWTHVVANLGIRSNMLLRNFNLDFSKQQ